MTCKLKAGAGRNQLMIAPTEESRRALPVPNYSYDTIFAKVLYKGNTVLVTCVERTGPSFPKRIHSSLPISKFTEGFALRDDPLDQ